MKRILTIIISILLVSGCSFLNKNKTQNISFNSITLRALIAKAVNGDTSADKKLNDLVNLNFPINSNYNLFRMDSLRIQSGKKFYLVLLNYPNPVYNRFAIYDSTLRLYLIDKSLNGNLYESVLNVNGISFVKIIEDFISKDTLNITRLSLYKIDYNSAKMVFRDFIMLKEPKEEFTQKITEITADRIMTEMTSSKKSSINNKGDAFAFNYSLQKYVSPNNVFYNFVIDRIKSFKHSPEKPEITDKKSMYASIGIDLNLDTLKNAGNTKDTKGYTLTLTNNWKSINNIVITSYLIKHLKGIRYTNEVLGASISVVMIPPQDSAEKYTGYRLKNLSKGKYTVRYSDKIISGANFIQYFEYSCGMKKYILILSAPRFTYNKYKNKYQAIINSFTIDC